MDHQQMQYAGFWAIAWVIAQYLIVSAISYFAYTYLAKKNQGRKPAGVTEFELPTAHDGRPVPHVRGKRRLTGFNCLTPIHNYTYDKKKKDGQTVAYYYYFRMWVGLCIVADGVKQIWAGGYCLAPTVNDSSQEFTDGDEDLLVYAGYVFGGYEGEGGQYGLVYILFGDDTQVAPSAVTTYFGDVPAARGIVTAYFHGEVSGYPYYWGTTRYPKWPSFSVKSTDKAADGTAIWNQSYANVASTDDDFNPAHAIYEMITDPIIGRGQSTSLIGTSFTTAASTLYSEGYGLSYILDTNKDQLQDDIDTICEIIDGFLYFDQDSGKYELTLARDDYDPDTLETFDESDFFISKWARHSPGKVPSTTVVHFMDRATNEPDSVTEDDIALLELQGGRPITQEYDYKGWICDRSVAVLVAAREQRQFSSMQATATLNCKRTMAHLNQGDVIKISYTPMQIVSIILRVVKIDRGDQNSGRVILEVVEDVYGTVYSTFGTPAAPSSGDSSPTVETDSEMIMSSVATSETGPY